MAKIKIKDLPKDQKISSEEMRKVHGGLTSLGSLTSFDAASIMPSRTLTHMPAYSPASCSSFSIDDIAYKK